LISWNGLKVNIMDNNVSDFCKIVSKINKKEKYLSKKRKYFDEGRYSFEDVYSSDIIELEELQKEFKRLFYDIYVDVK